MLDKITGMLKGFSGAWIIKLLVIVMLAILCAGGLVAVAMLVRKCWFWIRQYVAARRDIRMTEAEFRQRLEVGSPDEQGELLELISPHALGVSTEAFYAILVDVKDVIKNTEPASSRYYAKWASIQDMLRLERKG